MANGTNGDGWPYTPGAEAPRDQGDDHDDQCMARHPGFGCTCEQIQFEERQREVAAEPNPGQLIGPDDRDRLAAEDQGQYYCVGADTGVLTARDGRPVYATLAEWQQFATAIPGAVYVPITGSKGPRKLGPLFGSLPLVDTEGAPDIVGRMVKLISVLETGATMLAERIATVDQQLAGRTHERELLTRAAALIDPDAMGPTTEQALDWLAKYREVVS